jgi:uncharacterized membrane protein YfhO
VVWSTSAELPETALLLIGDGIVEEAGVSEMMALLLLLVVLLLLLLRFEEESLRLDVGGAMVSLIVVVVVGGDAIMAMMAPQHVRATKQEAPVSCSDER